MIVLLLKWCSMLLKHGGVVTLGTHDSSWGHAVVVEATQLCAAAASSMCSVIQALWKPLMHSEPGLGACGRCGSGLRFRCALRAPC